MNESHNAHKQRRRRRAGSEARNALVIRHFRSSELDSMAANRIRALSSLHLLDKNAANLLAESRLCICSGGAVFEWR